MGFTGLKQDKVGPGDYDIENARGLTNKSPACIT